MYTPLCTICHKTIPGNKGYVQWVSMGEVETAHKDCVPASVEIHSTEEN